MRTNWARTALAAVLVASATFGIVASAGAQQSTEQPQIDSLDMRSAPLMQALRVLTEKTGLQFVIDPSDEPFGKVTLKLESVSVETALKYVCQAAHAYYRRDESGVFIITHNKPEEVKPTEAVVTPAPVKHTVIKAIHLLHADPREVYEAIYDINPFKGQVFDTRVWQGLKNFTEIGAKSNVTMNGNVQLQNNNQSVPMPVGNSQLTSPKVSSESGGDIALPGESGGQSFGQNFGGGGNQGGNQNGGGQNGGIGGQNGGLGGQGGAQLTLTPGQGYVPQGITRGSYDPTTNDIIVQGDQDSIDQLRKTIELFDTAPKQVTVKVEFISTSSDLAKEIGYDWLYSRASIVTGNLPGALADTGNPIFASFTSGNVAVRMRTQLIQDHGKLVNSPIVRTLNNQPATVNETTTTSILIDTVVSSGNGNIVTAPTLAQISVQTSLTVAPRINRDGTVTMYLNPTYSDFGTVHQLPDGSQVPDTFSQGLSVVARVKNGETIVLGGLVHKNDQTQTIKYPILGDLPIIGQFFRKTNINNTDTELLIFVTPTVIEDDSSTNQGA